MTRRMLLLVVFVAALLSLACDEVSYDYDTSTDFSIYKTYAWKEGRKVEQDIVNQRIVVSTDAVLASRGLTKMEDKGTFPGPDLYVTYHAAVHREVRIYDWGYGGYGPGFWGPWYGHGGGVSVDTVPVGTLVIDIVDAAKNRLIWRSVGQNYITNRKPDDADRAMRQSVEAMLKAFPPKKK